MASDRRAAAAELDVAILAFDLKVEPEQAAAVSVFDMNTSMGREVPIRRGS